MNQTINTGCRDVILEKGVKTISLVPISYRIAALIRERNSLFEYPAERLAGIIKEIGFRCDGCARCCTRAFNGHVFLLDRDVAAVREIDPAAVEPAPDPEFCDQNGIFYVSGYALRAKNGPEGSCWFLRDGRCGIYDRRFSICRIYPYMLHRESDEDGNIDWRQISGLDMHGTYHEDIPDEECLSAARQTKEYEDAFLSQEIRFLEYIRDYFTQHSLRHVQKVYDDRMRQHMKGRPMTVMVYYDGQLEKNIIDSG
ncbi:MAG TPA: YkgJ family cysteine cluster protein [Methanoregulaceae archaeon]|nr:YkgJ family cysteine cluster protein [Methanoregulaceae archaeon]